MRRKHFIAFVFIILVINGLYANVFPVEFIPVNNRVTIHKSYEIVNNYKTASNGLIIETDNSVLMIDTAWNDEETKQIIKYINERINKPITACIITHFHQDRCGGINLLSNNKIPLYMTDQTYVLLDKKFKNCTYMKLVNGNIQFDNSTYEIEYFGKAHTEDNITVYDKKDDILFGGCLIKSIDSKTIGNIVDADISNWPKVINMIKAKYSNVKIIIPGHGEFGGTELLDHTLELLKKIN